MQTIIVQPENQHILSNDIANQYRVLPKTVSDSSLELYIDESNNNLDTKEELELFIGKNISLISFDSSEIEKALSIYYRKERPSSSSKSINVDKGDFLENL